jgi:hypothetical protein
VYATCKLYVPAGTKSLYQNAPEWKKFITISGIDDVVASQLQIFLNPAKTDLFIKSDLPIKKVEIYSLTGALLISENNFTGKISVSALRQGVYLLKIYTGKSLAVSKLVKE